MVCAASSGAEIRRHFDTSRIDLVLLDVMLGEEDGIKLCKELRSEQDVPIIFVSTLSSDQQRVSGYQVGADDYIAKPFNLELLLAPHQSCSSSWPAISFAELPPGYCRISFQWLAIFRKKR